jgi:hypothetical protein
VVTGTHRYADNGSYIANFCATDDDGDTGCNDVSVTVVNAPPVVDAGVDQTINAALTLAPATFSDLGVMDTHTSTVSWGDGITVTGNIAAYQGSGTISATHVYSQSGVYDVQICVTDNDGATGCDGLVVTATIEAEAPFATLWNDNVIDEGGRVTHRLTFTQSNAAYTHSGTVDWGDGTGTQPLAITNDNGDFGFAHLGYLYVEDGVYTATFTMCNDAALCTVVSAIETVNNLPPVVIAGPDVVVSYTVTLTETMFVDAGVLDVHTAVIDWGDGTVGTGVVNETNGSGTVEGTHVYMQAGVYTVEVCVSDDDGGLGCDTLEVTTNTTPPLHYLFIPIVTRPS